MQGQEKYVQRKTETTSLILRALQRSVSYNKPPFAKHVSLLHEAQVELGESIHSINSKSTLKSPLFVSYVFSGGAGAVRQLYVSLKTPQTNT